MITCHQLSHHHITLQSSKSLAYNCAILEMERLLLLRTGDDGSRQHTFPMQNGKQVPGKQPNMYGSVTNMSKRVVWACLKPTRTQLRHSRGCIWQRWVRKGFLPTSYQQSGACSDTTQPVRIQNMLSETW